MLSPIRHHRPRPVTVDEKDAAFPSSLYACCRHTAICDTRSPSSDANRAPDAHRILTPPRAENKLVVQSLKFSLAVDPSPVPSPPLEPPYCPLFSLHMSEVMDLNAA